MDLILSILFAVVAVTGLFMYFFIPSGIPHGGYVVYMGLAKNSWIWIHNKFAILMTILIIIHLILHRKMIVIMTRNFFRKEKEKTDVCDLK